MDSDGVLLQRYAAKRDADAFADLVRRYAGHVYGASLRVTGNPHDAEDVTQECFMSLARNAGSIRSSLAGWLHSAATSRGANVRRGTGRRQTREAQAAGGLAAKAEPT
jgi:DNA-directed RNA polymerase specialized sigma24 family protein